MGCGCNCNDTTSFKKKYYAEETEFGLELREIPKNWSSSDFSKQQYWAEETDRGLELREELEQCCSSDSSKHLVDVGKGRMPYQWELVIKHMKDQNEILNQIRLELKNLRKIGGI